MSYSFAGGFATFPELPLGASVSSSGIVSYTRKVEVVAASASGMDDTGGNLKNLESLPKAPTDL